MGLLKQICMSFFHKNSTDKQDTRSDYIFYKIVDSVEKEEVEYVLQCINTSATFHNKISDIVFDIDILYGLHPIQACYIGIEYAKYIKKENTLSSLPNNQAQKLNSYQICRYGSYQICYQERAGNICFIHRGTHQEFLMDPRDIALTEELIQEFDAAQAFYIGLVAGLKMNNPTAKAKDIADNNFKHPYLKIVK